MDDPESNLSLVSIFIPSEFFILMFGGNKKVTHT